MSKVLKWVRERPLDAAEEIERLRAANDKVLFRAGLSLRASRLRGEPFTDAEETILDLYRLRRAVYSVELEIEYLVGENERLRETLKMIAMEGLTYGDVWCVSKAKIAISHKKKAPTN